MGDRCEVYVALLGGEGVAVWRPVAAERVGEALYRLDGPVPDGESWQFQPGEVVRCEQRDFADGKQALTAVERARA